MLSGGIRYFESLSVTTSKNRDNRSLPKPHPCYRTVPQDANSAAYSEKYNIGPAPDIVYPMTSLLNRTGD